MALMVGLSLTLTACGDDDDDDPVPEPEPNPVPTTTIKVSPSVELLGTVNSTTTITVSATQDVTWTISGAPEWLSLNKSGIGSSNVSITATQENFSDEPREAKLTFTTNDGAASATCTVTQKGVLAANCRVSIGDMTIMSDGFAGDLTFDENCKGYKHGCFFASDLPSLTDRDVFNQLMKEEEHSGGRDHFVSPYFSPTYYPEVEVVYCIAAYGSETNPDGSHKYGPVTMVKIKTKAETPNSDMLLTPSYKSTLWTVTTYRKGSYGQRCDYYYYIAGEGSGSGSVYNEWMSNTDAYMAHFYFKPEIEKNADWHIKNGPQTLTFERKGDKFCCITWGKHNGTNEYSAELSGCWYPTNMNSDLKSNKIKFNKTKSIAFTNNYSYVKEMPKFNVCVEKK